MEVKVALLHPQARLPYRAHSTDAGADLYSLVGYLLQPGELHLFETGIALEIPEGYEGQIRPRSGLSLKRRIIIPNAPGTIDAGYRGEIKVGLLNLDDRPHYIGAKDRIAQLVIAPVERATFAPGYLDDSERGTGGFGSTGQ